LGQQISFGIFGHRDVDIGLLGRVTVSVEMDGLWAHERATMGPAPSPQGSRFSRVRFAAGGLDRMSSARQGLTKQLSTNGNVSFPFGAPIVPPGDIDAFISRE
jgi:hypothetical protein